MAQSTPETVVYVSNAGSKEVWALAMNRATGELHQLVKDMRANPKKFLRIKLAIF